MLALPLVLLSVFLSVQLVWATKLRVQREKKKKFQFCMVANLSFGSNISFLIFVCLFVLVDFQLLVGRW